MSSFFTSLNTIVLISVTLINLLLAFVVIKNDSKSATNRIFFLLGLNLSIWATTQYISLEPRSIETSLFWVRFSTFWAVPITPLFLLFINTLPSEKLQMSWFRLKLLIAGTIVVMLTVISPFAFVKVNYTNGLVSPVPGPAIILFSLFVVAVTGSLVYEFIRKIRSSVNPQRKQLIFVATGIILMLVFIVATIVIPVTVFQNPSYVSLFPSYTLFFTGLASYSIIKHKLFDLKVLATEVISIILWVLLFAKLFVSQSRSEFFLDLVVFIFVIISGVLLIRSVSGEVEQREKLQDLTDKLKAMDKQKDEFLSMAAHELRAPMTAIKGYVSMVMEGDTGQIPEKARGFLADTNNITDRLIRLVNNMLNVSRIEEGRMTYQDEEEYLSVPVRSVFSQFVPEAERKGLKYTLKIPKQIKDKVVVDPDRIQEVLGNFISNAVKYTDEGFVEVRMAQPDEKTVRVEVVDSGPGISKEEQKKLFQKFERVESNVGKTTGTGLGLYISKLLVEKFSGDIGVDSDAGKGSTFWFELPLVS